MMRRVVHTLLPNGGVTPIVCAVSAAAVAHFVAKLAVGPRIPGFTAAPQRTKWTPSGLLLGHLVELMDSRAVGNAPLRLLVPDVNKAALLRMSTEPRVLTANPADVEYVLNTNIRNFVKGRGYVILRRLVGEGILTLFDEDNHAIHRRELAPAFSPAALKSIAQSCFPAHAQGFLRAMQEKAAAGSSEGITFEAELMNAALRIVAQAAFKTTDEASIQTVTTNFQSIANKFFSMARMSPLVDNALIFQNMKVKEVRSNMRQLITNIATRVRSGGSTEARTSAVDYVLASKKLSTEEVFDNSITLMFAGFDTTSNALSWFFYLMAKHPEIQDRLYEELSSVIALDTVPNLDDLNNAPFLYNCCRESLRVKPPVIGLARKAVADDVLPGTKAFVPKGTYVLISLHAMHMHEQLWGPTALEYIPERWEDPAVQELGERGGAFAPFSLGRRNCIGKDFAMNEMKVLGSMIIRNFKLSWPQEEPEPQALVTPVLKAKTPFHLIFTPRPQ